MVANPTRILALCAVLLGLSAFEAQADRRVALVIGNAAYQNTAGLANPVNDAEDLAAALAGVGFEVLLERNLSKRGMESAIARFARLAQDADAALFYYAGHGMQHRGQNYFMPIDARLEDEFSLNFELTRIDDVLFGLERARGVKLLILDACRNNPLAERLARTTTTRDPIGTKGLAKIDPIRGMVIAYATQANQVAVDGEGRNSPFTRALVKHIDEPGLEVGTLFRRVAGEVNRVTEGRQLPELSVSLVGEFYVNRRESDLQAWAKVRASNDPEQLKDFLTLYPSSLLLTDARQRLDVLEREERGRLIREQVERARQDAERRVREQAERQAREEAQRKSESDRLERERLAQEQAARDQIQREEQAKAEAKRRHIAVEIESEKAATEPAVQAQTALLTPQPEPSAPKPALLSGGVLVREIKTELKRVGCYGGRIDEKWATAETKSSVGKFVRFAKLPTAPDEPSTDLLVVVRGKSARVCPLECSVRQVEKDGRCVARSCPAGTKIDSQGECQKQKNKQTKTATIHSDTRQPKTKMHSTISDVQSVPVGAPKSLVGRSVNWGGDGQASYGKNGSYKYVSHTGKVSVGRYQIVGSQVCVRFNNGRGRCDTIQRAGSGVTLTSQSGRSFGMR
jgi:sRNA-binding protein